MLPHRAEIPKRAMRWLRQRSGERGSTIANGVMFVVVMFAVATARQQSRLRSVWYDEAFTMVWMRADWEHFWQLARRDSGNGVGYVVALKLLDWLWPGSTVPLGLMEAVSILAWAGLLIAVYACFARVGHRFWGAITAATMALTWIHHQYATELRPYPIGAAMVGALLFLSLDSGRLPVGSPSDVEPCVELGGLVAVNSVDPPGALEPFAVKRGAVKQVDGMNLWYLQPRATVVDRSWGFIAVVGVLLFAAPLVHPLLIPLTGYFTIFFARQIRSWASWLILACGASSSVCIVLLGLVNPRGDSQLFWIGRGSFRVVCSQILDWFSSNGVFGFVHPVTEAGWLAALGVVLLLLWGGLGLPSFGRQSGISDSLGLTRLPCSLGSLGSLNPLTHLFRRAAVPLAIEVGAVGVWSAIGPRNYITYAYRYLYFALPLWIVASSAGLLALCLVARDSMWKREPDPTEVRSSPPIFARLLPDWLGYGLFYVLLIGVIASGPSALKQSRDLKVELPKVIADLVRTASLEGAPIIALAGEEISFVSMLASRETGDLTLAPNVALVQPFSTCRIANKVRGGQDLDLPAKFWNPFIARSPLSGDVKKRVSAWIILANNEFSIVDPCAVSQLKNLQGPKTLLLYDRASRKFTQETRP
jgi:hypothetical protein